MHVNQTRRAVGGAANGVDHRQVLLQQCLPGGHLDLRAVLLGQLPRCGFKVGRPHVRGGCVDQVAGQHLALSHGGDVIGVNALRRDQTRGLRGLIAVTVKTVACQ